MGVRTKVLKHRVEFVAYGRTDRGTKVPLRSVSYPREGLTPEGLQSKRKAFIEANFPG